MCAFPKPPGRRWEWGGAAAQRSGLLAGGTHRDTANDLHTWGVRLPELRPPRPAPTLPPEEKAQSCGLATPRPRDGTCRSRFSGGIRNARLHRRACTPSVMWEGVAGTHQGRRPEDEDMEEPMSRRITPVRTLPTLGTRRVEQRDVQGSPGPALPQSKATPCGRSTSAQQDATPALRSAPPSAHGAQACLSPVRPQHGLWPG